MSYKKPSFNLSSTQSTQSKPKGKGFILNKCLQMTGLTKSFFNCKTSTTRAVNYEFAPYIQQQANDTLSEFSNLPSSTMIESRENLESTTLSYQLMTNNSISNRDQLSTIERQTIKPGFVTIPSFEPTMFENESEYLMETENTRDRRSSILSISTFQTDNSNCETVIQHNNSPLSEYKTQNSDFNDSNTILYECFHSTKISSSTKNCSQCQMNTQTSLSPLAAKSNMNLDSPILSSSVTSVSPPPNFRDLDESTIDDDGTMQQYESMISYLSSTINSDNSKATHICTSNYEATFVDDVTVKFAEMVTVLKSNKNDEWVQIKLAADGRTGFVPKKIVLDIKQFINQLKQASVSSSSKSILND